MHIPQHFAVDASDVRQLVSDAVAGDLVTSTATGLAATFLPLLFDATVGEQGSLQGHVARNNDVWRRDPVGEALVIVQGPNAYISPSWYASKAVHGRVVPTWNYLALHVYGHLLVHDDVSWVNGLVRRLTERHESGRGHPWSVEDAPTDYVSGQLRAIVGLEIVISRVEAKAKMSQNRPADDIPGVVAALEADGRADVAAEVERLHR